MPKFIAKIAFPVLISSISCAQEGPQGGASVKPRELSGPELAARYPQMVDPEEVDGPRLQTLCDGMDLICAVGSLDGAPGVALTPEQQKIVKTALAQWTEFVLWDLQDDNDKTEYFAVASIIGEKGARDTFASTLPDEIVPGCVIFDASHNNLVVIDRKNWRQDGSMMLNESAASTNNADRKTQAAATIFHECLHCAQEGKTNFNAATVADQIAFWKSRKKSAAEHAEIHVQERAFALLIYEKWQELGLSQQPTAAAGNIASNAKRAERRYRADEKAACDKIEELGG